MSHECYYCKKKLRKYDEFVLIGEYPSIAKRYKDWFFGGSFYFGLREYGILFHKECFYKQIEKDKSI